MTNVKNQNAKTNSKTIENHKESSTSKHAEKHADKNNKKSGGSLKWKFFILIILCFLLGILIYKTGIDTSFIANIKSWVEKSNNEGAKELELVNITPDNLTLNNNAVTYLEEIMQADSTDTDENKKIIDETSQEVNQDIEKELLEDKIDEANISNNILESSLENGNSNVQNKNADANIYFGREIADNIIADDDMLKGNQQGIMIRKNDILAKQSLNYARPYYNDRMTRLEKKVNNLEKQIANKEGKVLVQILLAIIKLQAKMEAGQNFINELRVVKILVSQNHYLLGLVSELEPYDQFPRNQTLLAQFDNLAQEIRDDNRLEQSNNSIGAKLITFMGKFISIQKIDDNALRGDDVTTILSRIRKNIIENNFDKIAREYKQIPVKYQAILYDWHNTIDDIVKAHNTISEMIEHINNISADINKS